MKNSRIQIKKNIIIIYILTVLIPYNLNKKNNKIIDIIKQKKYLSQFLKDEYFTKYNLDNSIDEDKDTKGPNIFPFPFPSNKTEDDDNPHDHDHDDIYEEQERRRQARNNLTNQIKEIDNKIDDLNTEITKSKIYIIFLSVLTIILFIILIIYSSIKCYILCTKKSLMDFAISILDESKLGEVYIDENVEEEEKINGSTSKNKNEGEAPIYSDNNSNRNISTFNPDNYKGSDEDKNLYKPYSNEDIQ